MTATATATVIPIPARQKHRFILIIVIHVMKHVKGITHLFQQIPFLFPWRRSCPNHNGIEVIRTEAFDYLRAWTCGNHLLLCGIALVHCPVADSVHASFWHCHPQWCETVINPVDCHSSHCKTVLALNNCHYHVQWNKWYAFTGRHKI